MKTFCCSIYRNGELDSMYKQDSVEQRNLLRRFLDAAFQTPLLTCPVYFQIEMYGGPERVAHYHAVCINIKWGILENIPPDLRGKYLNQNVHVPGTPWDVRIVEGDCGCAEPFQVTYMDYEWRVANGFPIGKFGKM